MKRTCLLSIFMLLLVMSGTASATSVTLTVGPTGPYIIGEVIPTLEGNGGQAAREALMLNVLLDMGLNTRSAATSFPEYYRSPNDFGPLPDATTVGSVPRSGNDLDFGTSIVSITLPRPYQYLVAAWDGPNGGVEAWYIGGLAAGTVIEIPRYAHPEPPYPNVRGGSRVNWYPQDLVAGSYYQLTGWTLFNPTTVPDGGATATLLGLGVLGLGILKRFRG